MAPAAVPVARVPVTNSVVALVLLVKLCCSQYTVVTLPMRRKKLRVKVVDSPAHRWSKPQTASVGSPGPS